MASELRNRLIGLVEPLLGQLGYELVDVELAGGRTQAQLRIFIDRPEGVGIDDCEHVSRELSALLDVRDPMPTAYTLEVSSPGLDRVLRTPEHFARFAGSRVQVELLAPRDGRRRYTGALTAVGPDVIELHVDGTTVKLGMAEIAKARLAPEWPDPKRKR
jgi:ribosome maturation factor RimP